MQIESLTKDTRYEDVVYSTREDDGTLWLTSRGVKEYAAHEQRDVDKVIQIFDDAKPKD